MKTYFVRATLFLALLAVYPAVSHATTSPYGRAPEVDFAVAPGAVALLSGLTMMIRGRRKNS